MKLSLVILSLAASASAFAPSSFTAAPVKHQERVHRGKVGPMMGGKENELRVRIKSVSNTQKITTAMRLVAAAKVRRAQSSVLATRPFSEALQSVFGRLVKEVSMEDIEDLPLLKKRDVSKVTLVCMAGDRGLCGGYNGYAIKKTEARINELKNQGIEVDLVVVGKKPLTHFKRRATPVVQSFPMGQAPSASQSAEITSYITNSYLCGNTDSVEFIYTRFVSLISSSPEIRTMLPLKVRGIEMSGDEIFSLTTKEGKLTVERSPIGDSKPAAPTGYMTYEQDPITIFNAVLPLYVNGQVLRMLQESVASELAARMTAMGAASDNAKSLKRDLSRIYNRARQASVTSEILEIVAGANAASG